MHSSLPGLATVQVARITYVGELGYELHIPAEHAQYLFDLVWLRGAALGLRMAGLKALGSLRMEKGYRDYGHDIDNLDTLFSSGLAFTADWTKVGGFRGKDAALAERAQSKKQGGPSSRLVHIQIIHHPDIMMFHGEVVYRSVKTRFIVIIPFYLCFFYHIYFLSSFVLSKLEMECPSERCDQHHMVIL